MKRFELRKETALYKTKIIIIIIIRGEGAKSVNPFGGPTDWILHYIKQPLLRVIGFLE